MQAETLTLSHRTSEVQKICCLLSRCSHDSHLTYQWVEGGRYSGWFVKSALMLSKLRPSPWVETRRQSGSQCMLWELCYTLDTLRAHACYSIKGFLSGHKKYVTWRYYLKTRHCSTYLHVYLYVRRENRMCFISTLLKRKIYQSCYQQSFSWLNLLITNL